MTFQMVDHIALLKSKCLEFLGAELDLKHTRLHLKIMLHRFLLIAERVRHPHATNAELNAMLADEFDIHAWTVHQNDLPETLMTEQHTRDFNAVAVQDYLFEELCKSVEGKLWDRLQQRTMPATAAAPDKDEKKPELGSSSTSSKENDGRSILVQHHIHHMQFGADPDEELFNTLMTL